MTFIYPQFNWGFTHAFSVDNEKSISLSISEKCFFVENISLGVMVFFTAADPEENCHETCQQLGDGNGKPDTVRAEP